MIRKRYGCGWLATFALAFLVQPAVQSQALFPGDPLARRSRTYDVIHYRIVVSFDEAQKKVLGSTSITLTPLKHNLDSIVLDAVDMNVTAVSLGSRHALRFTNRSPELSIHFDRRPTFADTVSIVIDYTCTPTKGLYFIQPDSTDPSRRWQIWTQGEDHDNRYWFPCYDFPNDMATSEVIATVRDSYTLVSNGRLISERHDTKNGKRTFHWKQSKPHVSYLIMLAAGEYVILRDRHRNVPIQHYVYKEHLTDAPRSFANTKRMMEFFERKTGYPYPWDKYAQIVIDEFMYGGMENTSAVTLNDDLTIHDARAALDYSADGLVAHELAHQWWGDLVTCRDWTHLWLNEGFSTYFASLWTEHNKGRDEFQHEMYQSARAVMTRADISGRRPIVSHESYGDNLYAKGAWTLHMLRNLLGEEEFFRALQFYLTRHQFRPVDTHEFQLAVEDATGQNLDWFFRQWVYGGGHPELVVTSMWDDAAKKLNIGLTQTQEIDSLTGVFRFPLDIECTTSSGKWLTTVLVARQQDTAEIELPEKPVMVIVDKDKKLLKSLTFEKSKEELIYQIHHAGDPVDRIIAATELREYPDDAVVFAALQQSARTDTFWAVRQEAVSTIGAMKIEGVKEALFVAYNDRSSSVRNAAIVGLGGFSDQDVAMFIEAAARNDSSYYVLASCITAMERVDSTRAVPLAVRFVDTDSYRHVVRRACLPILHRLKATEAVPYALRYALPGNPSDIRGWSMNILKDVVGDNPTARALVLRLINDASPYIRGKSVKTLAEWGGDDARSAIEQRKGIEQDQEVIDAIAGAAEKLGQRHR